MLFSIIYSASFEATLLVSMMLDTDILSCWNWLWILSDLNVPLPFFLQVPSIVHWIQLPQEK